MATTWEQPEEEEAAASGQGGSGPLEAAKQPSGTATAAVAAAVMMPPGGRERGSSAGQSTGTGPLLPGGLFDSTPSGYGDEGGGAANGRDAGEDGAASLEDALSGLHMGGSTWSASEPHLALYRSDAAASASAPEGIPGAGQVGSLNIWSPSGLATHAADMGQGTFRGPAAGSEAASDVSYTFSMENGHTLSPPPPPPLQQQQPRQASRGATSSPHLLYPGRAPMQLTAPLSCHVPVLRAASASSVGPGWQTGAFVEGSVAFQEQQPFNQQQQQPPFNASEHQLQQPFTSGSPSLEIRQQQQMHQMGAFQQQALYPGQMQQQGVGMIGGSRQHSPSAASSQQEQQQLHAVQFGQLWQADGGHL